MIRSIVERQEKPRSSARFAQSTNMVPGASKVLGSPIPISMVLSLCAFVYKKRMPEANAVAVTAKVAGTVIEVSTVEGAAVTRTQVVVVLESMKLHYPVPAEVDGTVTRVLAAPGDLVEDGAPLLFIQPGEPSAAPDETVP